MILDPLDTRPMGPWAMGNEAMTSAALAPVTRSLLSTPQHEQIAALDILPEEL